MELGSFHWCPVPGQEAVGTSWNISVVQTSGSTSLLWRWLNTDEHWYHRSVADSPSFKIFRGCLEVILLEQGGWTRGPPDVLSNLNHSVIQVDGLVPTLKSHWWLPKMHGNDVQSIMPVADHAAVGMFPQKLCCMSLWVRCNMPFLQYCPGFVRLMLWTVYWVGCRGNSSFLDLFG